ncbi:hypothetical protein Dimus_005909, partial [Dionaea muscipula]
HRVRVPAAVIAAAGLPLRPFALCAICCSNAAAALLAVLPASRRASEIVGLVRDLLQMPLQPLHAQPTLCALPPLQFEEADAATARRCVRGRLARRMRCLAVVAPARLSDQR